MQFVFQPLTWGFLLVLVPLIAHLINLLRHRRVHWAAMEFLLESYRKHRRWVWMKQLLLLLARMAIMALLVAMLAQWVTGSRWLSIFGQTITHHYVLLDDSLSMSDTVQGNSAYQAGLRAVAGLLRSVVDDRGSHQVTVLRYSRATPVSKLDATEASLPGSGPTIDSAADILARSISGNSDALLEPLNRTSPVALSLSPVAALDTILPLIRDATNEQSLVYLISDFREEDWRQAQSIRSALEPLKAAKAEIQLIDCVANAHENLAIVALQPDDEVLAAGVPVMMRVEIRNLGALPARNVNLTLKAFENVSGTSEPRVDHFASGSETPLPSIVLDSIPPNETVSRRFQVIFNHPGSHVVQAFLPDDVLFEDNTFAASLNVVEGQALLVIDGDDSRRGSFYLNATLNPGGMTRTGWRPTTETPAFLRDTSPEVLSGFAAIVLMNVTNLDQRSFSNLKAYVDQGGGLAFALGSNLNPSDIERLNRDGYENGKGILPAAIEGIVPLEASRDGSSSPDMLATNHPIFAPLLGLSNSPFQLVRVFRYVKLAVTPPAATEPQGEPIDRDKTLRWQSILNLRDGSPLMIDHPYGKGRVIVFCSAIDPSWTTWPQDPTFVVGMLKTMGYLASFRALETSAIAGTPIETAYSAQETQPDIEVVLPAIGRSPSRQTFTTIAASAGGALKVRLAADQSDRTEDQRRALLMPGITELWSTSLTGDKVVRSFARHTPIQESDLKKISVSDLRAGIRPIEVKYRTADTLSSTTALAGLTNRQGLLLALLIGLLLIEQFLAWSASYHLPASKLAKGAP